MVDWKSKRMAQLWIGGIIADTISGSLTWQKHGNCFETNDEHGIEAVLHKSYLYHRTGRVTFRSDENKTPWVLGLLELLTECIAAGRE